MTLTVEECYAQGIAAPGKPWLLRHLDGSARPLPLRSWCGGLIAGDLSIVDRCRAATVDIGCGPGRITEALTGLGVPTLGIDITAEAVRQCRARGSAALRRDVFRRLPGEGRWSHAILADGNIGIGGDPAALLKRVASLLAVRGALICEADPPGSPVRRTALRLELAAVRSAWFPWSSLGIDAVARLGAAAGLHATAQWTAGGRWFTELSRI